jgi:hypothetical protein
MGSFVDPEYVRTKTRVEDVKSMEHEDIEDLLIRTAEARLEEEYGLDLDTDAEPRHWSGLFQTRPDKLTEFQNDMKVCVLLLIDRTMINPNEFASQSIRGASVTYGRKLPIEIDSLLRKWGTSSGKMGRLYR